MTTERKNKSGTGTRITRKIREVGLKNVIIGSIRKIKYMRMRKKYHFDSWHLSPYEWKEYAQVCVKYVNAHNCGSVVDIGCGLGEILQHVKADKKTGLDLQEEVIMAARELSGGKASFETGSFGDLREAPVDYLISLNFMHGGTEEDWTQIYHRAASRNDVRHFIVDTVPEKAFGPSVHHLDWSKILPQNYRRIERFGPFLSGRYVEVWERR